MSTLTFAFFISDPMILELASFVGLHSENICRSNAVGFGRRYKGYSPSIDSVKEFFSGFCLKDVQVSYKDLNQSLHAKLTFYMHLSLLFYCFLYCLVF